MSEIRFFVQEKDVGTKPKIMEGQLIQRMYECGVLFGHFDRSFLSPTMYKSASTKIIAMSGYVFQASSHLCNMSTGAVHITRFPS